VNGGCRECALYIDGSCGLKIMVESLRKIAEKLHRFPLP
jgi:hypothetical protein